MESEFVRMLVAFFVSLIIIVFINSGIDIYFDTSGVVGFGNVLALNSIFVIAGGITMLLTFVLMMTFEGFVRDYIKSDFAVTLVSILFGFAIMHFLKIYLLARFELVFNYPHLIVLAELTLMLVPLFITYSLLSAFGKAFKN